MLRPTRNCVSSLLELGLLERSEDGTLSTPRMMRLSSMRASAMPPERGGKCVMSSRVRSQALLLLHHRLYINMIIRNRFPSVPLLSRARTGQSRTADAGVS
jgi:hypothetical protein